MGLLLCGLLLPGPAQAQGTVRADVDARRVGLEDVVQLTVTVQGSADEGPGNPPLTNLRVVGGPSMSTQISLINSTMSQSRTYTWALQPIQAGRAEVGAIQVGRQATAPIAIEVVPGRVKPAPRQRRADPFDMFRDPFEEERAAARRPAREPKLFIEAVPSRTKVSVGEPLVLTFALYTQVSITDVQFESGPDFPGFWAKDLDRPKTRDGGEPAVQDGEEYRRFPLFTKLLFPTRAGTLTIPAARLRLGIPRMSFFDAGGQAVVRETKQVIVTVEPLPQEAGFNGAVGRLKATATLDRTEVPLGEAATLRFRVEGRGNLEWIDRGPDVVVPGAKVYPPQVKSDVKTTDTGLEGSRTWEYVVMPETAGELSVPALPFVHFDPDQDKLVRAETAPLSLRVAGGAGTTAAAPVAGGGTAPVAPLARPAGGLALRSDLDPPATLLPSVGARTVGVGLGGVLVVHGLLWAGARIRWGSAGGRPRGTDLRGALATLARVRKEGASKETAASLIEAALHDAFGAALDGNGAGERERAARAVLDEVRFLRYAPQLGDYSEKVREVTARAEAVVRKWA